MGSYDECYFQSFAIKRWNELTERRRNEGGNKMLNRKIAEIGEYVYKRWLIELKEPELKAGAQLLMF